MASLKQAGEVVAGLAVWAAIGFGVWSYCSPDPGYVRDPDSILPWRHVWTPGSRSPNHPHVFAAEKEKHWRADPGYRFLSTTDGKLDVAWSPGAGHPAVENIQAGTVPGRWVPDPGYRFAGGREESTEAEPATWTEGIAHSKLPHLRSGAAESIWHTEPGYVFAVIGEGNDGRVRWQPNSTHPISPYIRSDSTEGQWVANPGYRFADTNSNRSARPTEVHWVEGEAHPNCPKAITTDTPGTWRPAAGYRFVGNDRLDVERIPSSSGGGSMSGGQIAANIVLAFIANVLATPASSDGMFTSAGRFVAKEVRDQAARNVIRGFTDSPTPSSPELVPCDYWSGIPIGQ